jgi:hypothetical protein
MAEINLLPAKEFEIILEDKSIIKGKFSLWSVKRYCDKKGLTLAGLENQLSQENISMDDLCVMLLCAVEHTSRVEKKGFAYTDMDVCDWIEQLGGITSEKYTMLMNHAKSDLPASVDNGEKKSL